MKKQKKGERGRTEKRGRKTQEIIKNKNKKREKEVIKRMKDRRVNGERARVCSRHAPICYPPFSPSKSLFSSED